MSLFPLIKSHEDTEQEIIDAEFSVITTDSLRTEEEPATESAITESGLQKLFLNWSHLEEMK